MTTVNKVNHEPQTKKTEKKEATAEKTQPKSADVNSTNPSERAKNIQQSGEIKDGKFQSRSDATVGDIAQANAMKEDGTVDPAAVKQNVKDIVANNPQLAQAAKDAGINLENPTEEDLQKLANLDVKAGQEVNVPAKAEEAKTPEEKAAEEKKAEEAEKPEGNCNSDKAKEAEKADDKKQGDDPLSQIMDLIQQAEQAKDPSQKKALANQAIQMINQLRQQEGIQKGQGDQQQGAQGANNNQQGNQLVQQIQSGGQVNADQLKQVMGSGDKGAMAAVLDALEARANRAANNNSNPMMNALNNQGQQNQNLMNLNMPQFKAA